MDPNCTDPYRPLPATKWPHTVFPRPPWGGLLPVYGIVAPGAVYRSGQPTLRGLRTLEDRRFKTVVSLRAEGPPDQMIADHATSLKFFRFAWVDEEAPPPEIVEPLLACLEDPAHWPLLVHCLGGRGRSSVACGMLRYRLDGWDFAEVMREVREYRVLARPLGIPIRRPLAAVQRDWLADYCRERTG